MRWLALTAAVSIAVGCSPSPEKAAHEAKQAAGSWGATLSAAAEHWGSNEISTSYFQSVLTQARSSLAKEAQSARKSGGDTAAALLMRSPRMSMSSPTPRAAAIARRPSRRRMLRRWRCLLRKPLPRETRMKNS
jgi:hypothetical protein